MCCIAVAVFSVNCRYYQTQQLFFKTQHISFIVKLKTNVINVIPNSTVFFPTYCENPTTAKNSLYFSS